MTGAAAPAALTHRAAPPAGAGACLGLIVLRTDETIEHEFRRLFADPDLALFVSRIPMQAEVTPATLTAMAAALPAAAGLLPDARTFDAVGYACTSGATLIGPDRVDALVRGAVPARAVTDPMRAAQAALAALGARRIALVSPYIAAVAEPLRAAFEAGGFAVPVARSFDLIAEAAVARIDPDSVVAAAVAAGAAPGIDAVFLSCTNLRTLEAIPRAEAALGKPVISSNLALAWAMAGAAGRRLAWAARLADAGPAA